MIVWVCSKKVNIFMVSPINTLIWRIQNKLTTTNPYTMPVLGFLAQLCPYDRDKSIFRRIVCVTIYKFEIISNYFHAE